MWCQKERLDKSGLSDYIDEIYCSDNIGSEKPFAQFYNAVLEGSGCLPEETMMVGDSLIADVKGAKEAGLSACFYNPDGKEDSIGADYVITKLEDLTKIL